jgi:hypothetical protein
MGRVGAFRRRLYQAELVHLMKSTTGVAMKLFKKEQPLKEETRVQHKEEVKVKEVIELDIDDLDQVVGGGAFECNLDLSSTR